MDDKARYAEGIEKDWMRQGADLGLATELVAGMGGAAVAGANLMARRAALKTAATEAAERAARQLPEQAAKAGDTIVPGASDTIIPGKAGDTVAMPKKKQTVLDPSEPKSSEEILGRSEWKPGKPDADDGDTTPFPIEDAPSPAKASDYDYVRKTDRPAGLEDDTAAQEAKAWAQYGDNTATRLKDADDYEQYVKKAKDALAVVVPAPILEGMSEEQRDGVARAMADAQSLGAETAEDVVSMVKNSAIKPYISKMLQFIVKPETQLGAGAMGVGGVTYLAGGLPLAAVTTASVPLMGLRAMARLNEDDPAKKVYNSLESNAKISKGPVSKIDDAAFNVLVDTYLTPDFEEAYQRGIISDELFAKVADAAEKKSAPAAEAKPEQATGKTAGWSTPTRTEGFKGRGGWGYELLPDGNVRITDAPPEWSDRVGKIAKAGTEAHGAIMAEYRERFGKGPGGSAQRDGGGDIAHRTAPNSGKTATA